MPYAIKRKGRQYQVVNTETGDIKASSTSKAKAEKQLRLLRGLEHGWTPTGQDTFTRKIKGRKVTVHVSGGKKDRGTHKQGTESA